MACVTTALFNGFGNGYHWLGRYAPDLARAFQAGARARANELGPAYKAVLLAGTYLRDRYASALYGKAHNLRPAVRAIRNR